MISIFTRPVYIGNRYHRYMPEMTPQRLSCRIRGEEIAQFLHCKLNPKDGYEDDTCVWVKPVSLKKVRDMDYLDVLDHEQILPELKTRPKINLIAASLASYTYLIENYPNDIIPIMHQHLNWDREQRTRKQIKRAGYIGPPSPVAKRIYGQIGEALESLDIEFITCFDFKTRLDAVDFYKSIDILVIGGWELGDPSIFKMPTKIINAASFGIPTVAYPLKAYQEIEGHYLPAKNMDDLLVAVNLLRDPVLYETKAVMGKLMAEDYHIERIAELYRTIL